MHQQVGGETRFETDETTELDVHPKLNGILERLLRYEEGGIRKKGQILTLSGSGLCEG